MSSAVRVVLDTNVVLSALVFRGGAAAQLRLAWQGGQVLPLVCTATIEELLRVLAYPKFSLSKEDQDELLADYLPYTETVQMPVPPPLLPDCRDSQDLVFMQLVVAGDAKVLVTGDKDLMVMAGDVAQTNGCAVLTLNAFTQTYCVS